MFYILPLDGAEEKDLAALLPFLSEQRRKKVDSYRFFADKMSSAAAFCLLIAAVWQEKKIKIEPTFEFGPNEKPYFAAAPRLFFSLSHDRKGVGVCLGEEEVGADVQEKIPYDLNLAKRVLSNRELSRFDDKPSDELFTMMWTMKESLGKKTGEGVYPVLMKTDFSHVKEGVNQIGELYYTVGRINDLFYAACADRPQEVGVVTMSKLVETLAETAL